MPAAIIDGNVQNAGPLYRAGSILNGKTNYYDKYFIDSDCIDCNSGSSFNYLDGDEMNNSNTIPNNSSLTNNGWQEKKTDIGIPTTAPQNNGNNNNNQIQNQNQNDIDIDPRFQTPSLEELMKPTPPKPMTLPKNINQKKELPDSNNFTLENLRQLDPTINDPNIKEVKIIRIEDKIW
jgi:hypothetical protein